MTKEESRPINLDQSDWEIIYSARNPELEAYLTTGMWNEGLFPEMAACLHKTIEEQGPTELKQRNDLFHRPAGSWFRSLIENL